MHLIYYNVIELPINNRMPSITSVWLYNYWSHYENNKTKRRKIKQQQNKDMPFPHPNTITAICTVHPQNVIDLSGTHILQDRVYP